MALDEPPDFKAAENNPDVNKAFMYILGYDNINILTDQWDALAEGKMTENAGCNICFPSVHDSYQAPAGKANAAMSQMAPYNLDGDKDKWLNIKYKKEIAEKQIALLQKYAPNLTRDKVLCTYVTTPADIENKFANMVKGGYKQGAYHPLQMGYLRPNQDCSHYRTPVKNLYVGGASVAPGGMVIWGPGYNCANAVAEDCGIEKWWKEPEYVTKARENGYI
jgi:phytoene dehydrogenase-like protein